MSVLSAKLAVCSVAVWRFTSRARSAFDPAPPGAEGSSASGCDGFGTVGEFGGDVDRGGVGLAADGGDQVVDEMGRGVDGVGWHGGNWDYEGNNVFGDGAEHMRDEA